MSEHVVVTQWQLRPGEAFTAGKYSRRHEWHFDSGQVIAASPSPSVVRAPYSDATCVDPEEAFVASIASCHLLTFLYLASKRRHTVLRYAARAVGKVSKNARGVPWVSRVEMYPEIEFEGQAPSNSELEQLHHDAHAQCFIANSVKTEIVVLSAAHAEA